MAVDAIGAGRKVRWRIVETRGVIGIVQSMSVGSGSVLHQQAYEVLGSFEGVPVSSRRCELPVVKCAVQVIHCSVRLFQAQVQIYFIETQRCYGLSDFLFALEVSCLACFMLFGLRGLD